MPEVVELILPEILSELKVLVAETMPSLDVDNCVGEHKDTGHILAGVRIGVKCVVPTGCVGSMIVFISEGDAVIELETVGVPSHTIARPLKDTNAIDILKMVHLTFAPEHPS